jgi:hypothetical protein
MGAGGVGKSAIKITRKTKKLQQRDRPPLKKIFKYFLSNKCSDAMLCFCVFYGFVYNAILKRFKAVLRRFCKSFDIFIG